MKKSTRSRMKKGLLFLLAPLMVLPGTLFAQVYQLPNPGFENWDGTTSSSEPAHWNGFPSANCALTGLIGMFACGTAKSTRHAKALEGRPGSEGTLSCKIYSTSAVGIVANGNLTTGQIHIGSTTASNAANYNVTLRSNSEHAQLFDGRPDSLVVWCKFVAHSDTSHARINAVLHGDYDYYDPGSGLESHRIAQATHEFQRVSVEGEWVRYSIPYVYNPEYVSSGSNSYLLISITTNRMPGGGSAGDTLYIDDLHMVYNTSLSDLKVDGATLAGFDPEVLEYDYPGQYCLSNLPAITAATAQSSGATVSILPPGAEEPTTARVVVANGDGQSTYQIHFNLFNETPLVTESSRCGAGELLLAAEAPQSGDSVRWYASAQSAVPFFTGESYATPTLNQSATYYVSTYRPSTGCESMRIPITAHLFSRPVPPIVEDLSHCGPWDTLLSVTVGEGCAPLWYGAATGGELLHTGNPYPISITENSTLYVQALDTLTQCVSTTAIPLNITIYPIPTISYTIEDDTLCAGETARLEILTDGASAQWYDALDSQTPIHTGSSFSTRLETTTTFYAEASQGNCLSGRVPITVEVIPFSLVPEYLVQPYCDSTLLTLTKTEGFTYQYTHAVGGETEEAILLEFTENDTLSLQITEEATGCSHPFEIPVAVKRSYRLAETIVTAAPSYSWQDSTYLESGIYEIHFTSAEGCDSTRVLDLTFVPSSTTLDTLHHCGSYTWEGQEYAESGVYQHVYQAVDGSDSLVILLLTIGEINGSALGATVCQNEPYQEYGFDLAAQTVPGTYTHTLVATNASGCDSTVTLTLTVQPVYTVEITDEAGSSYTWNDSTYYESGDYTQHLLSSQGCDSTVTLHLILTTIYTSFEAQGCLLYLWDGREYDQSGSYSHTYTSSQGADSIVTLHLTLGQPNTSSLDASICQNEGYAENGFEIGLQSEAGTFEYTRTATNISGCDSVITLTLTVHPVQETTLRQTACESYFWMDTILTESGEYERHLTSSTGCDSLVILDLTLYYPTSREIFDTICQGEAYALWDFNLPAQEHVGDTLFTRHHTVNTCDSTTLLHLTVQPSYFIRITDTISTGESYDRYGFFIEHPASGIQRDTLFLQTGSGCDSTVQLLLFIMTGIEEYGAMANIHLYPNPAQERVTLLSELPILRVDLYNLAGMRIFSREIPQSQTVEYDVAGYAPGLYILKIHTTQGIASRKLVIEP